MINRFYILLIIITYILQACNSEKTRKITDVNKSKSVLEIKDSKQDVVFNTDWKTLTNDFNTWYNYTYNNVRLAGDFIGLDVDSTIINKEAFLNKLLNENVVAFKIKIFKGDPVYKLYPLRTNDESIKSTIKQFAETELNHYRMEGREMKTFSFTDLSNKHYDNASTKGKIVVLKCWFIHCVACVKEFPELNNLVYENKTNTDILFISLAIDSSPDLKKFLKTKQFDYAVIPGMENFMTQKLNITEYPTHILIGRDGKILKVVNKIDDLIPFINKEVSKNI